MSSTRYFVGAQRAPASMRAEKRRGEKHKAQRVSVIADSFDFSIDGFATMLDYWR